MTPADFPQANASLRAPKGMTEADCGTLHVFRDGRHCISCWRPTLGERLRILVTGKVWLWVWAGTTQPPVALQAADPWVKGLGLRSWLKRWRTRRAVGKACREAVRDTLGTV